MTPEPKKSQFKSFFALTVIGPKHGPLDWAKSQSKAAWDLTLFGPKYGPPTWTNFSF